MTIFTNQATLTYRGTATNSNIVTGTLVDAITVTKTAVDDTYRPGDTVTYAISILNTANTAANNLTVTDDLGAYTATPGTLVPLSYVPGTARYYINGVLQANPAATAGPPLVISGINVPAGGNALLLYETEVGPAASPAVGGSITNTVTVTGDAVGAIPATDSAIITAAEEAVLGIRKDIGSTNVTVGDRLTYTFTIQNSGNTAVVAGDTLTVTDTFDPILTDIVVTLDGETLTENTDYTYNEATGEFATIPGRVLVPDATITQDINTGNFVVTPGTAVLTVTGTV